MIVKCIQGDCFNLSKLNLSKAKLIIADPDCGWPLEKHYEWIEQALNNLIVEGIICVTGHEEQNLFQTKNKDSQYMIFKKINENNNFKVNIICIEKQTNDPSYWYNCMKEIIKKYTKENDLVIDLFSGKGQVCFSSKVLGRKCIGIEHVQEKVDLINKKLDLIKEDKDVTSDMVFKK